MVTLKDLIFTPQVFETSFINARGEVYSINRLESSPEFALKSTNAFRRFIKRVLNRTQGFDYGLACGRLTGGIRYTIGVGEHLNDRVNPTQAEIIQSQQRCERRISSMGPEAAYLTI